MIYKLFIKFDKIQVHTIIDIKETKLWYEYLDRIEWIKEFILMNEYKILELKCPKCQIKCS